MNERSPTAMRNILIAVVLSALFGIVVLITVARAQQPISACGSYQAIVYALAKVGENQVFQGVMLGGKSAVIGFASAKKNTWTVIITAEGGLACIVAAGTDYEANRLSSDPT